jgi:hypothetical protein
MQSVVRKKVGNAGARQDRFFGGISRNFIVCVVHAPPIITKSIVLPINVYKARALTSY